MQVRIIDTVARDSFHEVFNAALLVMCLRLFGRAEYHCHPSQRVLISNGCRTSRIRRRRVARRIPPCPGRAARGPGWVCRYAAAAPASGWRLVRSGPANARGFNYNNPLALPLLDLLNGFLHRRVLIVCHGELELLAGRSRGGGHRAGSRGILRRAFGRTRLDRNLRFCVLGNPSCATCARIFRGECAALFAIDHPGFFEGEPAEPAARHPARGHGGPADPGQGFVPHTQLSGRFPCR